MRILMAILIIAGLAVSAFAQGSDSGGRGRHHQQRTDQPKRKAAETPRPVLNNTPYPKSDPWQGVRDVPKSK